MGHRLQGRRHASSSPSALAGTQPFRRHRHKDPPQLDPSRPTRVSPSDNGSHEISATTPRPPVTSSLDQLLPHVLPVATSACILVSVIALGVDPFHTPLLSIAEHGPGLTNGVATVDDASFTTRIKVHSGPSASHSYGLVALPDTGSPQIFISAKARACMKANNAASTICKHHAPPRSWGGFGNLLPSSLRHPLDLASSSYMGTLPPRNLPCGLASIHTVLCNTLSSWDATAGCASSSVHTQPRRQEAGFDDNAGGRSSVDERDRDGLNSPCARIFSFHTSTENCEEHVVFVTGEKGNRLEGNENQSTFEGAVTEWVETLRLPRTSAAGRHTKTRERIAHHHESSCHRIFFLDF